MSVRSRLLRLCLLATLGLTGCGVPAPDGPADTYGIDFTLPQSAEVSGAIVFVVDGLNAETFEEMLQAGELPAFQKYFIDRGLYAPRAVANTPSVTLVNLVSIATGEFAGHHDILGINQFDRNRLIGRDYATIAQKNTLDDDYTAKNIFEYFPDKTTISVFFQPHRFATKFIENWLSAGPPFFFRWYEFVDRLTLYRFHLVAEIARQRNAWPAVTVVYLLAPDFNAYDNGATHAAYLQAIRHADRQIGRVCGDLERAGLLDKLYLALVSDHGHADVKHHFPMKVQVRKLGISLTHHEQWENTPFEQRQNYYNRYAGVICGSGDRYIALYLRAPREDGQLAPWLERPTIEQMQHYPTKYGPLNLPETLTNLAAVDAVAYATAPETVQVKRLHGVVEFRQPEGKGGDISFRLVSGTDPLEWNDVLPPEALNGQPLSPQRWLELTQGTLYPDLPAQILAYFRSRNASDLAIFAMPQYDFFDRHRAGHGGLRPSDMLVPMAIAGPGIPVGQIDTARTVDLTPTLLHLLGKTPAPDLDGKNLLP